MKKAILLTALLVCVAVMAATAFAWEMSVKGDVEWRYRYWTRSGIHDIFGDMGGLVNLGLNHLSTFPTTATTTRIRNTYPIIGVVAGEDRYGSDMNAVEYRMTVYPRIKVNPAITVDASVNFTSLGIHSDGLPYDAGNLNTPGFLYAAAGPFQPLQATPGYVNSLYVPIQDRPANANVPNTFVTLQWIKAVINTPSLDFSIGYKNSSFGMGLWKHGCNRASTSFGVISRYGPFRIGFAPYFAREQSTWAVQTGRNEGFGSAQRHDDRRNYFLAAFGEMSYSNGPLVIEFLSDSYRQKESSTPTPRGAAISTSSVPSDDVLRYRLAFAMRYFDGRFFFNGEVDSFNRWRSGRGTASSTTLINQNRDDQAWLYGAELGCLMGPSKVTLNYVRATGDDPSTRHQNEDAAVGEQGINACYIGDWGYLMYHLYGTGDGWDSEGYGQPTNFHHLGLRVDHAIASNLNVFGVFSYAWRDQPNGYRMGGDYGIQAATWTNEDIRNAQLGTFRGRAVPDSCRIIGYEVDVGVQWKLLENLTWSSTFACWWPGNWWGAAYPNTSAIYQLNGLTQIGTRTSVPGNYPAAQGRYLSPATNAANEGIAITNFGRNIDPLMAFESKLLINF